MCGGCGRTASRDQWSEPLASWRARWEAARLLNDLLERAGHPGRVLAADQNWVVRTSTGGAFIAQNLSTVMRCLSRMGDLPSETASPPQSRPPSAVADAVLAALSLTAGATPEWASETAERRHAR